MSEIFTVLESALARERYLNDLFSQLRIMPNGRERRRLLAKIEHFRRQRHPAMEAWLAYIIHQEEAA